jgi:hypothetical protein
MQGFKNNLTASKMTAGQSYCDNFEQMEHHYSSIDPNFQIYKKESHDAADRK